MKKKFLKQMETFREALSEISDADEDIQKRLETVQSEIEDILRQGKMVTRHRQRDFILSLKRLVDDFELSHPELTAFIGQMAESLARMGI